MKWTDSDPSKRDGHSLTDAQSTLLRLLSTETLFASHRQRGCRHFLTRFGMIS